MKPAIDAARRLVVHPTDVAYLRRGEAAAGGALPPLFTLGRDSAVLMMRFSVPLPVGANVIEAYVVLRRSDAVDDDPAPISLHATRIVEGWEQRSVSWSRQPRVVEVRTPGTLVEPGGPSLVRIDVRDLVRQWPKHDPRDQGVAIVAASDSQRGTTFAFRAVGVVGTADSRSSSAADVEPYLELYLR